MSLIKEDLNSLFAQERSYCVLAHIKKIIIDTKEKHAYSGRITDVLVVWQETRNWFEMEVRFMRSLFEKLNETDMVKRVDETSKQGLMYVDKQFRGLVEIAMSIKTSPLFEL
jgi:hypothetical protein